MNKVANDLKNFAPQAPAGMEERIQKALSKKKSFWSFSWYSMNVYVVALLSAGVLALVFSNNQENGVVANNSVAPVMQEKAVSTNTSNVNASNAAEQSTQEEYKAPTAKTNRRSQRVTTDAITEPVSVQDSKIIENEIAPMAEISEVADAQRMPEEIQVPKTKTVNEKPKGRSLKLTRFTGK